MILLILQLNNIGTINDALNKSVIIDGRSSLVKNII